MVKTKNGIDTPCSLLTEVYPNSHAIGGIAQPNIKNPGECIVACKYDRNCTAIDFSAASRICFFHNLTTACRKLGTKPGLTHTRIKTCSK